MHIEKYNNNGIDYLRLVEGKRMRAPNGKSRTGKRVLLCIGALSSRLSSRLSHMSPPNHAGTS